jgi:hypothetical protein
MASDRSVRHTVAAEMNATTPRVISWLASSAQLQRDNGTPLVAGSSHAKALISVFTEQMPNSDHMRTRRIERV